MQASSRFKEFRNQWSKNWNRNTPHCVIKCTIYRSIFDAPRLREKLSEVEKQTADPTLWSNPEKSQQVMREKKHLETALATEADLSRRAADIGAYFELAREGEDVSADLRRELDDL